MAQDPSDSPAPKAAADPALDSLEHRLARTRRAEEARLGREHAPMANQARGIGMQVASTMLGYPLGGIIIGWGLDSLFGTRPWIMISLMFMAFAGACLQVVRTNNNRRTDGGN